MVGWNNRRCVESVLQDWRGATFTVSVFIQQSDCRWHFSNSSDFGWSGATNFGILRTWRRRREVELQLFSSWIMEQVKPTVAQSTREQTHSLALLSCSRRSAHRQRVHIARLSFGIEAVFLAQTGRNSRNTFRQRRIKSKTHSSPLCAHVSVFLLMLSLLICRPAGVLFCRWLFCRAFTEQSCLWLMGPWDVL